jgi:hypothetical protein
MMTRAAGLSEKAAVLSAIVDGPTLKFIHETHSRLQAIKHQELL